MDNLDEGTSELDSFRVSTTASISINTTVRAANRKEALSISQDTLLNEWLSSLPPEDTEFADGTVHYVYIRVSHGT